MTSSLPKIVAEHAKSGKSPCKVEAIEELKGSDQEKLKEMVAEGGQRSTKEIVVHLDISTLIMVYGACAYQIAVVIVLKQREGDDEPELDRGDLKKLKTDENEKAGQEKKNATTVKILEEYAKSGRSSCKKCSEKIESKSIRLGLSSWEPRGFETTKWHHIDCFFPLDADLASAESIEGFSDLKSSHQEKLKKLVSGVYQSSREVLFTGNLIISSSDSPSSPQPTTPSSSDSNSPQHTRFPSYPQCASQQPYFPQQNFQMNQYAFNQMALFQLQQQYPFNNFGAFAWDVLKGHSKWRDTKAVVPGRRVRTVDDVEDQNELFRNDPQPLSKPRLSESKKLDKDMFQEKLRQNHEKRMDLIKTQLKFEELKFLAFSTIGLAKEDAEMINKMKEKIRAKYLT
ncbi:zinc finger, PARP-type [Artemisia annua]|uniref:Zinc finger, PARP-type n=1 Tax=Artemisia annua TaxID=35608 RepID=A0A2U1LZW2_ARTAN|nr:zinc finger, PARP-type [Artemisia annua]